LAGRPEVVALEGVDARQLTPALIPEPLAFAVVDVSFISLKLVLPPALALLRPPAWLIALIKPQFEAGRRHLKKGIVRDPQVHAAVCDDIAAVVAEQGLRAVGVIPSPITGGDGNHEFLIGASLG
jgi:23S rRNA (cytidine1920-2'-O)/16S rRNA (cytidine1409-2'-O)-methyltransferase